MKNALPAQNYADCDNEALTTLAQNGDSAALALLTQRFMKVNRARYPAGYLEIEDLNQEGMLGFLAAVRTYSPEKGASFETYASKCIHNRIRSAAGRVSRQSVKETDELDGEPSGAKNPLDALSDNETFDELLRFFKTALSEKEQKVLALYIGGFSCPEIAIRLHISPKSADNALQRAKRKLKIALNGAFSAV